MGKQGVRLLNPKTKNKKRLDYGATVQQPEEMSRGRGSPGNESKRIKVKRMKEGGKERWSIGTVGHVGSFLSYESSVEREQQTTRPNKKQKKN